MTQLQPLKYEINLILKKSRRVILSHLWILLCEEQLGAAACNLWPWEVKDEDTNHYAENALLSRTERQNLPSSLMSLVEIAKQTSPSLSSRPHIVWANKSLYYCSHWFSILFLCQARCLFKSFLVDLNGQPVLSTIGLKYFELDAAPLPMGTRPEEQGRELRD